jgi:hypothetical protein
LDPEVATSVGVLNQAISLTYKHWSAKRVVECAEEHPRVKLFKLLVLLVPPQDRAVYVAAHVDRRIRQNEDSGDSG